MTVILDTHAVYWFVEDDPKLSSLARTTIGDSRNEILVSAASYWEIAIKVSLGKWQLNRPYEEFIDIALESYKFGLLPVLSSHTTQVIGLPFHHKDPFDRMLVAQALTEQVPSIEYPDRLHTKRRCAMRPDVDDDQASFRGDVQASPRLSLAKRTSSEGVGLSTAIRS